MASHDHDVVFSISVIFSGVSLKKHEKGGCKSGLAPVAFFRESNYSLTLNLIIHLIRFACRQSGSGSGLLTKCFTPQLEIHTADVQLARVLFCRRVIYFTD